MSYELILAAARNCDIAALTAILKSTTIDVWKPGQIYYPAISQLAKEKNVEAVNFLLEQGASLDYAALGAALGGDQACCEDFIAKGASLKHAALGAALGGDHAYCDQLIARGAGLAYPALGAVLSGDHVYCEKLIAQGADLDYATMGAALVGDRAYCEDLIARGASRNHAVLGAALGGDRAYCKNLIAKGASLDYVAWGAGLSGDYAYCDELIAQGININSILLGAAQGGHRAYCKKLIERGASLRYAVEGAALGGHYVYCEELIAGSVGLDGDYAALLNYALLGAARGGCRTYCDKLMKRGAKREYAAQGAAQSGRYVYCNELIGQALREDVGRLRGGVSSTLTSAIRGAAQGGYYKYCDQLIEWGAARVYGGMWLKNAALMGAALSGDHRYCDTLIDQQTVQPENAIRGAALRGDYAHLETRITKENVEYYLYIVSREVIENDIFKTKAAVFYYLVHFENSSLRNRFIRELYGNQLSKEIKEFLPKAQKQIQEIFYLKDKYDLNIYQAMVMWENRGLLSLWVLQVMPQLLQGNADRERPALNVDILLHITRYLFPALQMKSFEDISFKVIRYFLTASIDHYVSPISLGSRFSNWLSAEQVPPRLHLARAQSFQKESQLVESKKELARLCIAQSALFNKNNLIDEEGCTTLFYAVANGITPAIVVQELLDNGAALNIARKSDGETPLNLAVRQANVKMIALLIDYGANPNQKNKANETAYDIAKQLDQDVAEKIVEILGSPIPRPILQAHEEGVNSLEANDPFVEILEHTCARLR